MPGCRHPAEREIHLRHWSRYGHVRQAACGRLHRRAGSLVALSHDLRWPECRASRRRGDGGDGAEFIRRAEAAWGRPIRILAGEDEARLAAEGVVAGIPNADGLAADLGGGSLDMVSVKNGQTGAAYSFPFGPLRLMDLSKGDPDKARIKQA